MWVVTLRRLVLLALTTIRQTLERRPVAVVPPTQEGATQLHWKAVKVTHPLQPGEHPSDHLAYEMFGTHWADLEVPQKDAIHRRYQREAADAGGFDQLESNTQTTWSNWAQEAERLVRTGYAVVDAYNEPATTRSLAEYAQWIRQFTPPAEYAQWNELVHVARRTVSESLSVAAHEKRWQKQRESELRQELRELRSFRQTLLEPTDVMAMVTAAYAGRLFPDRHTQSEPQHLTLRDCELSEIESEDEEQEFPRV